MKNDTANHIGRSRIVTVFGGSGFVGRHVVGALAKRGYKIRVAVRRPDLAFHLQPLGSVGQIQAVQANLRYGWSVERAIEGADGVVNLVGILTESGKQRFQNVQSQGAGVIAQNCKNKKLPLVHVSSIGADVKSASDYCRTKGEGEKLVHANVRDAIIMRPSIIFGSDDGFFNRFAEMARMLPVLPLPGGGSNKFQPVYVGDVAEAICNAVDGNLTKGKIYELGGREVLTFRQCMDLILSMTGRTNPLLSIPWPFMRLIANLTGWMPGAPVTPDQIKIMQDDNIVSALAIRQNRTLEGIGIEPKTLAAILPNYLVRFRPGGQFNKGPFGKTEDA